MSLREIRHFGRKDQWKEQKLSKLKNREKTDRKWTELWWFGGNCGLTYV